MKGSPGKRGKKNAKRKRDDSEEEELTPKCNPLLSFHLSL